MANYPWRTPYNSKDKPKKYETITEPSRTIPDQTMPLPELLRRHALGLPTSGNRVPVYHGEDLSIPDLDRMDLAELQELKEQNQADIKRMQKNLKKASEKDTSTAAPSAAQAPKQKEPE